MKWKVSKIHSCADKSYIEGIGEHGETKITIVGKYKEGREGDFIHIKGEILIKLYEDDVAEFTNSQPE